MERRCAIPRFARSRLFATTFVIVVDALLSSGEVRSTFKVKPEWSYNTDITLCRQHAAAIEKDLNGSESGEKPYRQYRFKDCEADTEER